MTGLCKYCKQPVDASTGYTFPESIIIHATCLQFLKDEQMRMMRKYSEWSEGMHTAHSCNWCGVSCDPGATFCSACRHQPHVDPNECACEGCRAIYGN